MIWLAIALFITYAAGSVMHALYLHEVGQFDDSNPKHWAASFFLWLPIVLFAVPYGVIDHQRQKRKNRNARQDHSIRY